MLDLGLAPELDLSSLGTLGQAEGVEDLEQAEIGRIEEQQIQEKSARRAAVGRAKRV